MSILISKQLLLKFLVSLLGLSLYVCSQALRDDPNNGCRSRFAHLGSKNIAKNKVTKSKTGRNLEKNKRFSQVLLFYLSFKDQRSTSYFSLNHQYGNKKTGAENIVDHQIGDIVFMYPKLSKLNFKRIYQNESVRGIKIFNNVWNGLNRWTACREKIPVTIAKSASHGQRPSSCNQIRRM